MTAEGVVPVDTGRAIDDFGHAIHRFVTRAQRGSLSASLFDVPRRTEIAGLAYSACVPAWLEQVVSLRSPELIGAAMRRTAARPNALHVVGIMWLLLFHREEQRLRGDRRWASRDDEIADALASVVRILTAMRGGVGFLPTTHDPAMRILDDDTIAALAAQAIEPTTEQRASLRKLVATLELYSFVIHGEHRDGIFSHGPYPLPDGRYLIVRDFTDLENDFLAWTSAETRLAVPDLTVAFVLSKNDVGIDLWGTLSSGSPDNGGSDYWDLVDATAVVTGPAQRTPDHTEVEALVAQARAGQLSVFRSVARWSPEARMSYGTSLFANHLRSLAELAGLAGEHFLSFVNDMEQAVQHYRPMPERSPIWHHLATSRHPFSPLQL